MLLLAQREAAWFVERLLTGRSLGAVVPGLICFAGSAWAVFTKRYALSRIFAVAQIALLVLGWGLAQHPYLAFPDITFASVAAPEATLQFLLISLPFGAALILPSLWMLFRVFGKIEVE